MPDRLIEIKICPIAQGLYEKRKWFADAFVAIEAGEDKRVLSQGRFQRGDAIVLSELERHATLGEFSP